MIKAYGENCYLLAKAYDLFAEYYYKSANLEQAVEYEKQAIEIAKDNLMQNSQDCATYYLNLAKYQNANGDFEAALSSAKYAEKIGNLNTRSLLKLYSVRAEAYMQLGNREKADENIELALAICEDSASEELPQYIIADAYFSIGTVYSEAAYDTSWEFYESSEYSLSWKYLLEASAIYGNFYGDPSEAVARVALALGDASFRACEIGKAKILYKTAFDTLRDLTSMEMFDTDVLATVIGERLDRLYAVDNNGKDMDTWVTEWLSIDWNNPEEIEEQLNN